jgi:hypothetical protein
MANPGRVVQPCMTVISECFPGFSIWTHQNKRLLSGNSARTMRCGTSVIISRSTEYETSSNTFPRRSWPRRSAMRWRAYWNAPSCPRRYWPLLQLALARRGGRSIHRNSPYRSSSRNHEFTARCMKASSRPWQVSFVRQSLAAPADDPAVGAARLSRPRSLPTAVPSRGCARAWNETLKALNE